MEEKDGQECESTLDVEKTALQEVNIENNEKTVSEDVNNQVDEQKLSQEKENEDTEKTLGEVKENQDSEISQETKNGVIEDDGVKKNNMIEEIQDLLAERETLKKKNAMLQNKLSTTFFNKPKDKLNFQEIKLPIGADECTYRETLGTIDEMCQKINEFSDSCENKFIHLKEELQEKETRISEMTNEFDNLMLNTALKAVNSETGEQFDKEYVKNLLEKQEDRNRTLLEFRFKSIKESSALEKAIKKKQMLATAAGALNFAEFEMMVTELENNKVKIPRIKNEVDSFERKCCNMITIMSHMSQKLHFVHSEKSSAEDKTSMMVYEVDKLRKMLDREKRQFIRMQSANEELQHEFILLQHPDLIEDFKCTKHEIKEQEEELKKIMKIYNDTLKIISTKKK